MADPSKITVVGGSHGGILTTHLIGQAPDKFAAAAARNLVCNLALMSGTTDISEWCFVETYGTEGEANFTDRPSKEQLNDLYDKSPIAHANKALLLKPLRGMTSFCGYINLGCYNFKDL